MYNELMQGNFEIVDLDVNQCDRKTFKAIRKLVNLNCGVHGLLANKARNCYRLYVVEHNLFGAFFNKDSNGKLFFDCSYDVNKENRTIKIFGRVTPLFKFRSAKRV